MGYPDYEAQVERAQRIRTTLAERDRIDRVIATGRVLQEVWSERDAQDIKWGQQNWPLGNDATPSRTLVEGLSKDSTNAKLKDGTATWYDILGEEFAEFGAAPDLTSARNELVQTAAVAVAAVERIDRLIKERDQARALKEAAATPYEGHDITRDTLGGCSPTSPCPACQIRLATKKES